MNTLLSRPSCGALLRHFGLESWLADKPVYVAAWPVCYVVAQGIVSFGFIGHPYRVFTVTIKK